MENKKGENIVVNLKQMMKMEVEKEPILGSAENEKRISFWSMLKQEKHMENDKGSEKGDHPEKQQEKHLQKTASREAERC